MSKVEPRTLKGFRDFLPREARKRQYVTGTLQKVFESYGFEPLETPVLEYEEILTGKYGEEGDKLMYRFEDLGKRKIAMRYDQTVPLARVVAQYQNQIAFPFKRYQIQPVWRAENTQKGRYREFIQCDIDTIGTDSPLADAEIIAVSLEAYKRLGFKDMKILINDRAVFGGLPIEAIIAIDKLKKIGEENVCRELVDRKVTKSIEEAKNLLRSIIDQRPSEGLQQIINALEKFGVDKNIVVFTPTLARGLNYYTGIIIEVETEDYEYGSLGGGGRYDDLIGMFTNTKLPAVGFSFGFDRVIEAMDALNLFPQDLITTKVLVTLFSPELKEKSLEVSSRLRSNNINTELYLGENAKMEKQLKYADQKNIPYVVIIGPEESEKDLVTVKNMKTGEQKQMRLSEVSNEITV